MSILGAFQAAQQSAKAANLQRYQQGMDIYNEIIGRYSSGGALAKGVEATLARTKTKDMASGMQSLASSGLANTTMAAGLGKKWEEEVGTPARLSLADTVEQRLSQAQQAKAGFIERRTDTGPDPGMVSSLMRGMGQGSGGFQPQGASRPSPYTFGSSVFGTPEPSPHIYSTPLGGSGYARMQADTKSGVYKPKQPTPSKYSYGESRYYA